LALLALALAGCLPARDEAGYASLEAASSIEVMGFEAPAVIFPALYRSQDPLVTFSATCWPGEKPALVEVEIPGFTQKVSKKVTLDAGLSRFRLHPPLLAGDLSLGTSKDAQLKFTVTDLSTGQLVKSESVPVLIMAADDAPWYGEGKGHGFEVFLAWMAPESQALLSLKRAAVDYLEQMTGGELNALIGYQSYGIPGEKWKGTWYQSVAILGAMGEAGIRYNSAITSSSSDEVQRVLSVEEALEKKSGVCIEMALVMASALESSGMHAMLVFPPGHAQVAVETWAGSGEYLLIETTVIPMEPVEEAYAQAVRYLDTDAWVAYISGDSADSLGKCYIVDTSLSDELGIRPMSN
jgi:hypothetical protein